MYTYKGKDMFGNYIVHVADPTEPHDLLFSTAGQAKDYVKEHNV